MKKEYFEYEVSNLLVMSTFAWNGRCGWELLSEQKAAQMVTKLFVYAPLKSDI